MAFQVPYGSILPKDIDVARARRALGNAHRFLRDPNGPDVDGARAGGRGRRGASCRVSYQSRICSARCCNKR